LREPTMKVRDGLSKSVVTVGEQCSLHEAAELMRFEDVGALLVVKAGRLVGIVTDRDLAVRGLAESRQASTPVSELMSQPVTTIQGGDDVTEALRVLRLAPFRRLPVLEGDRLIGILTVDDLLVALVVELTAAVSPIAVDVMSDRR
jgi:CBS domain-containing protein